MPSGRRRTLLVVRWGGLLDVRPRSTPRTRCRSPQAFEKKYGVKVELWRASSEKVLQRAVTEARAGRHDADVIETNGPELEALYREKLLEQFCAPALQGPAAAAFATPPLGRRPHQLLHHRTTPTW